MTPQDSLHDEASCSAHFATLATGTPAAAAYEAPSAHEAPATGVPATEASAVNAHEAPANAHEAAVPARFDLGQSLQEKYRICTQGLAEFAAGMGATDVVLGLSGGIDSSLVAVMCVQAFGADHVHGYMLPGPYSTDHSLTDAQKLADNLGISASTISIVPAFQGFSQVLSGHCDMSAGLAAENTQARCRMAVLMALANAHGWMMVNTGNKSEAQMGYSTLYGDTAGAYAPIGGLYKTDVFAMSAWVNDQAKLAGEVSPIPEHVLTKPPSAELAPNQRDEDTLGSYAWLDRLLVDHVDRGMDVAALQDAGYDPVEASRVISRVAHYAFKRALEPEFPPIAY